MLSKVQICCSRLLRAKRPRRAVAVVSRRSFCCLRRGKPKKARLPFRVRLNCFTTAGTPLLHASPSFMSRIQKDALKDLPSVSFREMIQFGDMQKAVRSKKDGERLLIASANFCREQIPVRMARIILDVQSLPHGVAVSPSALKVLEDYCVSYDLLSKFEEVKSIEEETRFFEVVMDRMQKHLATIALLCAGILETNEANPAMAIGNPFLTEFINRVMKQRITNRVMIGQHLSMHRGRGSVFKKLDVSQIVGQAIDDATGVCAQTLGYSPTVNVRTFGSGRGFFYLPQHVRHMTYELLKNSLRATVEMDARQPLSRSSLPPDSHLVSSDGKRAVDVIIVESDGEAAIKISDIGGGIPRQSIEEAWLYSYSTAVDSEGRTRQQLLRQMKDIVESDSQPPTLGAITNAPMFGLGYGLPVAKLYAQYYNGDCELHSVHGYGTDAYLFLANLKDSNKPVVPS